MSEPGKIFKAINAVMADLAAIGKDRNNAQQGFKYRGIDDIYNEMHGPLTKHGVFTVPTVLESERSQVPSKSGGTLNYTVLKMQYRFYADDGSFVDAIVQGEAMDSGDKSSNKAMAVAHKYALLQTFCTPTEDQKDPDEVAHQASTTPRVSAPPITSVTQVGAKSKAAKPKTTAAMTPEQVLVKLNELYNPFIMAYPNTNFAHLLKERYGVSESSQMSSAQSADLVRFMELEIAQASAPGNFQGFQGGPIG